MRKKRTVPTVLFNASVVLAGLKSPSGGSAKLLKWSKKGVIKGTISEVIFDEILRNIPKIGLEKETVSKKVPTIFSYISKAPPKYLVEVYQKITVDPGDAHILASSYKSQVNFMVTLDKKHLLVLKGKVKKVKIVSPAKLIEILSH